MTPRQLSKFCLLALALAMPFLLSSCVTVESATVRGVTARGGTMNPALLAQSTRSNTRVVIDIADQKAFLLVNGKIAARSPISTARPGKSTPRGSFTITERVRSGKISTIYKVEMPYWMRLGGTPFGLHAGYLPGYPASAGCIRLPMNMARTIYDHTGYGTRVSVYSSWSGG